MATIVAAAGGGNWTAGGTWVGGVMSEKICRYCEKENNRSKRSLYCSRYCAVSASNGRRSLAAREKRAGKKCLMCEASVDSAAYQALYCSRICKSRAADFRKRLRMHNLIIEKYNRFLQIQNNACAICHSSNWGIDGIPRIDHNHITGVVRGLLCNVCNLAIGMLQDDPVKLRSAAAYLEREL